MNLPLILLALHTPLTSSFSIPSTKTYLETPHTSAFPHEPSPQPKTTRRPPIPHREPPFMPKTTHQAIHPLSPPTQPDIQITHTPAPSTEQLVTAQGRHSYHLICPGLSLVIAREDDASLAVHTRAPDSGGPGGGDAADYKGLVVGFKKRTFGEDCLSHSLDLFEFCWLVARFVFRVLDALGMLVLYSMILGPKFGF
ncbi:uncharacterized protein BO97DRAFT_424732 [Aspergillus homomorphus CBS 101889]|uniref:Uncharacterized protein n=1 Tax=Aspergillus homomorphus (strain CBS 101889) TaxID=1450537 RepID=A0A395HXF2_ASPHC|nr:hypothetical protein BO97DRAFT_424732 [Aspergillus homomorphus CBS 101889]RAL12206.1 hypothetical protein BO97DRAFT_424732 [Aspergillus homomorphus CBS 101889]